MGQTHADAIPALRPTLRPPAESTGRGFLGLGHRNMPLALRAETINGCPKYGNGDKAFFVEAKEGGSRITLRVTEAVGRETSPYEIICKLVVEPGAIRINDIRNVYPGSELDPTDMHEPPLPEWKGFKFFPIILERVKKIASEKGINKITIDPDNADLGEHFAKFGFTPDPERAFRMQLTF